MDSAASDSRPPSTDGPSGHAKTTAHATTQPHRRRVTGCRTYIRAAGPRATLIVSDIDDVLLTFEPHILAKIEQRHSLPGGRLRHVLTERPTALAASVGMLDQDAWLEHARAALPASAIDEWLNYHGTPNGPVVDLLRQARNAGCRIVLFGNGTARRRHDLAYHHLTDLAETVYLSADIGRCKPDPEAWRYVLARSGTDPARSISIEAHASWAGVSRHVGMRSHHYINADRLRRALAQAVGRL